MEVWQYLQPDNPLAGAVVVCLKALFALWIAALAFGVISLLRRKSEINRCDDVGMLRDVVVLAALQREKKPRKKQPDTTPSSEKSHDESFSDFCLANRIKTSSPIAIHIRLIFNAGLEDGRLDPSQLCKHTTDRLFRSNALSRSVLTTFIVIGLFGTLFGLADSLSHLSPSMLQLQSSADTQGPLSGALSQLLSHLKNAFAPSIWGILFTVVGVFLLGLYNYAVCLPLRDDLSRLTLGVWVPQLFPTTQGRLLKTLDLSERQIQSNLEHVRKVADFATKIEDRVGGLNESLEGAANTIDSATEAMQLLTRFSSELQGFGNKFGEAITGVSEFQIQITTLYGQLLSESKGFHDRVAEDIKAGQRFQDSMRETIGEQHEQLKQLYEKLKVYEEAYLAHRQTIDAGIENVLGAAEKAFVDIAARNDQIVQAVGTPLTTALVEGLERIQKTLDERLQKVQGQTEVGFEKISRDFIRLGAPIADAAEGVANLNRAVVENTTKLIKDLKREFNDQNEVSRNQIVQLNEVNKRLETLLTGISTSAESQGREAQSLSAHVGSLAQNVASLSGVLSSASRGFDLSERQITQLAALERQGKDLVEVVNASVHRREQQTSEVRSLTDRIGDLIREVAPIGAWLTSFQRSQQRQEPVYQPQSRQRDDDSSYPDPRVDDSQARQVGGPRSSAPSTTVPWELRDPGRHGERRPDVREPFERADRVPTTTAFVGPRRARRRNWFSRMAQSIGSAFRWRRQSNDNAQIDSGPQSDGDGQSDSRRQNEGSEQGDSSGQNASSSQGGGSEQSAGSGQNQSGEQSDGRGQGDGNVVSDGGRQPDSSEQGDPSGKGDNNG